MQQGCFIGIDQGSSGTKSIVVGTDGQMLFHTRRDLPPPFRDGVRVEQDGEEILRSVNGVLEESLRAGRASGASVLGLGLSCQRSSCLAWNASTGRPLSPVISWRDTRGSELVEGVRDREQDVFRLTGLPLTPYYSASKLRWLKDTLPAGDLAGAIFGTLSSFLCGRLTAGPSVIDHTNAARTQLMNIATLAWDEDLLGLFGLTGIALPAIVPSGRAFGMAHTAAGDVPLLACLGDQQAAMLGLGVAGTGDAGINLGTGGFLMVNTGDVLAPAKGLMASVHYSREKDLRYLLEGSVNAVGDALEWARKNLGLFKDYEEVDDLCWKAAGETVAFIGLNGTGAPHWEQGISSAFHGLGPESTAADMVRAIVEGFAFFLKDIAEEVRKSAIETKNCVLAGGPASITYLSQITADILGTDLRISAVREASAMGAAFLAGMQHGSWTAEDIRNMASAGEVVKGEPNPGLMRRYERWKELHRMTKEMDGIQ